MVPEEFIREQLNSVLSDMSVDVVSPFLPSFFFFFLSAFPSSTNLYSYYIFAGFGSCYIA